MRFILFFATILLINVSCSKKNVDILGDFTCFDDGQIIVLEKIVGSESLTIDTAVTKKGKFNFTIDPAPQTPALYNIRYGSQVIPLLVAKGDKIKVSSIGNISKNYKVTGSEGSSLLKEIGAIMNSGATKLDSLSKVYISIMDLDEQLKKDVSKQYSDTYYQIKRDQLAFIVKNKGSLAAIYALYQRLPGDQTLFTGENDVIYLELVSDSISSTYPESPYLAALNTDIKRLRAAQNATKILSDAGDASVRNYPDIQLPDMYGNVKSLSELEGKVVLLDFWMAESAPCRLDNAELIEIYDKYAKRGFEIYQVSLDKSKPMWVTTVQDQKLKWVSVCDFKGEKTAPVSAYNISKLPSSFLLDREGNIVARDLRGKDLEDKIKSLL